MTCLFYLLHVYKFKCKVEDTAAQKHTATHCNTTVAPMYIRWCQFDVCLFYMSTTEAEAEAEAETDVQKAVEKETMKVVGHIG